MDENRESANMEVPSERRAEEVQRIEADGIRIEVVHIHDENDTHLSLAMNCSNG